ncbi:hypothetical protein [Deinococcus aerophilus]|uniref:Oxidoreductase molybdopterin-binding domain-containing protein n=1 Tax=Deinococcus aerophilus TaxID=522488 RepID=A0ABQ2GTW6_9DEIO|nr:hypothetical protein [Deinococcus aerophilus]GGM13106.1 hypothetical protein GCM10010841_22150 [Deinococcus aerophilus]
MFPPNLAPRRTLTRVRLIPSALIALLIGAASLGAAVRPSAIPATPPKAAALPAFPYVHGARPMPRALPGERTVFTLEGPSGEQDLTLRQLQALPAVRYATTHLQLKRTLTYQGVPLRDLAARGGFAGKDLRISASNGFSAVIRAADYLKEPIMLAYLQDGQPISILDKGPLTVVLPPGPTRFTSPTYASAWVWFAVRVAPVP